MTQHYDSDMTVCMHDDKSTYLTKVTTVVYNLFGKCTRPKRVVQGDVTAGGGDSGVEEEVDVVSGVSFKETLSSDGPSMCTGFRRSKDTVFSPIQVQFEVLRISR